ncbi:hypothetical protein [Melghirimyces algeriensis]|uniref:Uncharacterized protein n=1 Tax=Melghirimyces algeriensis TaxID=910412 RepID=A0A521E2K1_9BACL|nr:hypothetical protein [Melghirimyces algeriensis]SMO78179.1 hypothetical protein SAMN06264849_107153 [Melghirimyces algeriensis]
MKTNKRVMSAWLLLFMLLFMASPFQTLAYESAEESMDRRPSKESGSGASGKIQTAPPVDEGNKPKKPVLPQNLQVDITPEVQKDKDENVTGLKVTGNLTGMVPDGSVGSGVKGTWNFIIQDHESGKTLMREVQKNVIGEGAEQEFPWKDAGTYRVIVQWKGEWDRRPLGAKGEALFTVEEPVDEKKYSVNADHTFEVLGYDDQTIEDVVAHVSAKLEDENGYVPEKVQGTWSFDIKGVKGDQAHQEFTHEDGRVTADYSLLHDTMSTGKMYDIEIRFEGNVAGQDVSKTFTYPLAVPGLNVDYDDNDEKHTISGEITLGKKAQGDWVIGIFTPDGEQVAQEVLDDREGLKQSVDFKELKPGKYVGVVVFRGSVDDKELGLFHSVSFQVDQQGGDNKPDDDSNSVVSDPDTGEQIMDDVKGGKIPQTSTQQPQRMLYGVIIAGIGFFLLGFVYRQKIGSWLGI